MIYKSIPRLTREGRDWSLASRITCSNVRRGWRDGRVIEELAPGDDEIWLLKSA